MRALLLAGLFSALLVACRSTDGSALFPTEERRPKPPLHDTLVLPDDWSTMPVVAFERFALEALPEGMRTPLFKDDVRALSAALDDEDVTVAARAAILLGRSRSEPAGKALMSRLARRVGEPFVTPENRNRDAPDVIAAAALARFHNPERWWKIVRLVDGKNPHPDLEVRVECAATALHIGQDRVIPFLLKVLRIGTWAGQADRWEHEPPPFTTWARGRAAQALSTRAGVPLTYHPDAPLAVREREARRLEEALAGALQALEEESL